MLVWSGVSQVVCYWVFGDDLSTTIITLGVSISASIEFWCWEFSRVSPCPYGGFVDIVV